MTTLRLASCMAENTEALCRAVAQYLGERLKIPTEYVTGIPWQEREARFDRGEIQVLWLCGLPYVNKADLAGNGMELLAVPVPLGARYQGRAVYFSDVVVRRQSRFERFADLRGAAWAYNEPRSHSGFNVVRAHLSELGEGRGFFTSAVEAGAHARALELVLAGAVDGAAIDSLVLEWFAARWPEVMAKLRVIETLGPSPIPPWVVSSRVPDILRGQIRELLLDMDADPCGRSMLAEGGLARFGAARDSDYEPIRLMARQAERVLLT